MDRNELVTLLAAKILNVDQEHPVRVAIDGFSATGKTTLAHELTDFLRTQRRPAVHASLDEFKRPWSESHLYDRVTGEGYYWNAYDYELVRRVLLNPLGPGGDLLVQTRHINPLNGQEYNDEPLAVSTDTVLLVDGVFLFRPELNDSWDVRIFLQMNFDLVLQRGAVRDQAWEPDWSTAAEYYRSRYIPSEQLYVHEVNPRQYADVILDMSDPLKPIWL